MDYCSLMKAIAENPKDKIEMTVRQAMEFRAHVAECWQCGSLLEALHRLYPEEHRIGPSPDPN